MAKVTCPVLGSFTTLYAQVNQNLQVLLREDFAATCLVDIWLWFAVGQKTKWRRVGRALWWDEGYGDRSW